MSVKVKSIIISIVLLIAFAGIGIGLYCAWPAITGTITNSKYYTSEDLQEAYDKGFDDAFKNKDELTQQVAYYKELTDTYYISILDYQAQINDYEILIENNQNTISSLEQNKEDLQLQVDNLTTIKNNNETTIANLNNQIISLQNQVTNLIISGEDKSEQIIILNNQITNLQNTISQLQTTNELNINTITSLNTQIANLNNQISEMTLISQNSQSQINALNNKIIELQKSVTYYESYIASLENGEQVVATFEFDGSVYNIQIVNKGSKLAVTNPTSTTYKIFNGWTINGETIDLNTYTINTNTKIVADVTYKYDVKFVVDETIYNSQIITKNGNATFPINPIKDGYEFDGWSLNGVDLITDIASKKVTANTTYVAVFTKLHTVTFMSDGQIISTQAVKNGGYVTLPSNPTKDGFKFKGWSLNGVDIIIDIETKQVSVNTTYIAVFTRLDLIEMIWNGFSDIEGRNVWTDGVNYYYSYGSEQYVLDKETSTWNVKTWNGFSDISGFDIWTDGDNIYYSNTSGAHYVLDKETSTWNKKYWNGYLGSIAGRWVWTDGDNIYYSSTSRQYVLDKETSTWNKKTWNGFSNINGSFLWTDGDNIYYSSTSGSSGGQYVLDKETSTWNEKTWSGFCDIHAPSVWSDDENIYYGSQYVLDKETSTWNEKTWSGFSNIEGSNVWTDGVNYYYSYGSKQYVFNRSK